MNQEPRVTLQGIKVLSTFMKAPKYELSGADIAEMTSLLSGTLYPILIRFEKAGWLKSRWEDSSPVELGRPKRRLYKITGVGQRVQQRSMAEIPSSGGFVWAR